MGHKYHIWHARSEQVPASFSDLTRLIEKNRNFLSIPQLIYGDYGLEAAKAAVAEAINCGRKIALYADYDVDGTMSCVSWVWFLEALGYTNYTYYIPCRFSEGYGLNMDAMKYLIDEQKAELIITMDTGITANEEAAYCKSRGVEFICTDHHKIQLEKMPDCIVLNPKLHPDPEYQELCGCGITFVLLRKLEQEFPIPLSAWTDILALVGMATICDVVPLNSVNHRLANLGVSALLRSQKNVLVKLRQACSIDTKLDEKDVGFRIGPRINAVGRLKHASVVVEAFIGENPEPLIKFMGECNEERKLIQKKILEQAREQAERYKDDPILFLGGDWHPGVVGIAASKICEEYWKPTWLYQRQDGKAKGSARSIPGVDVTELLQSAGEYLDKFGGHAAAAGYSFDLQYEHVIRSRLIEVANELKQSQPDLWRSRISFDCQIPLDLTELELARAMDCLKPFGHGFEEPLFCIEADVRRVDFYKDKTTGEAKHTAISFSNPKGIHQKVLFFNEVVEQIESSRRVQFLVSAEKNSFRGQSSLTLIGKDWKYVN